MKEIKIAKLIDGSMVVGRVDDECITDIVDLIIQPSQNGVNIGLAPYMFPMNQDPTKSYTLPTSKVMATTEIQKELESQYLTFISPSGIIAASSIPAGLKEGVGLKIVK